MNTTKTKYKVKGLNNVGETIRRTVTLDTPIFKEKKHSFDGMKFTTTVEEQLDVYIIDNNIDLRNHVKQQDMDVVLNWEVVTPKNKSKVVVEKETFDTALAKIQKEAKLDDEFVANIAAVYYNMKDVIGHLPVRDQIRITLKGVDVAALAGTEAYRHMTRIMRTDLDDDPEYKELYNERKKYLKENNKK